MSANAVMNDLTMNIEHGNDQGNYDRERWKKEREDGAMAEFKKTEQFQDLVKEAEKVDHMFEGEMEIRERHLKYGRNPISADLMERLRKHPLPPKIKCKNGCGRWNADSRFTSLLGIFPILIPVCMYCLWSNAKTPHEPWEKEEGEGAWTWYAQQEQFCDTICADEFRDNLWVPSRDGEQYNDSISHGCICCCWETSQTRAPRFEDAQGIDKLEERNKLWATIGRPPTV